MTTAVETRHVQPGDVVQVAGRHVGDAGRIGEIVAVLGEYDHPHYLVRWQDEHESVLYPREGISIRPGEGRVPSAD
jgi:rRNA processing protein Gar1